MATENEDSVLSLEGTEQSSEQLQVTQQVTGKTLPKSSGHFLLCLIIVPSQIPTPRLTHPGPAVSFVPLSRQQKQLLLS